MLESNDQVFLFCPGHRVQSLREAAPCMVQHPSAQHFYYINKKNWIMFLAQHQQAHIFPEYSIKNRDALPFNLTVLCLENRNPSLPQGLN